MSPRYDWLALSNGHHASALLADHMLGCHLIEGAGHWVQQEQPQEVSRLLLRFLHEARP
jgi:pimeloyl-ACP methyl ester carboxylesterase